MTMKRRLSTVSGAIAVAPLAMILAALAGCPSPAVAPAAVLASKTDLALAGPRCQGGACTCRSDSEPDAEEQGVPPGHKRFEFRLPRTTSTLWVSVAGKGTFFKPADSVAPACFYVDLPSGQHGVTVKGELTDKEVGLQMGLDILEHSSKEGPKWYRSLNFVCGSRAGRCTHENLDAWIAGQRALQRGVLDPCGSTMVRGVSASGDLARRDDPDYRELTLRLTLKIYTFEPFRPSGSPECRAPVKNE
jgi:hypothetical protein